MNWMDGKILYYLFHVIRYVLFGIYTQKNKILFILYEYDLFKWQFAILFENLFYKVLLSIQLNTNYPPIVKERGGGGCVIV